MEVDSLIIEDDELKQVVSVQSEDSIFQRVSENIKTLTDLHSTIKQNKNINDELEHDGKTDNEIKIELKDSNADAIDSILRTKLQDQIRTGEITPFQATKKELERKNFFSKEPKESTQLLDLEKYLLNQAELAKKKKLLKKRKDSKNEEDISLVRTKKFKPSRSKTSEKKNVEPRSLKKKNLKTEDYKANVFNYKSQKVIPLNKDTALKSQLEEKNNFSSWNNSMDKKNDENLVQYQVNNDDIAYDTKIDDKSGSEYFPSDDYDSEIEVKKKSTKKKKNISKNNNHVKLRRVLDDGDESMYKKRLEDSDYKKCKILHELDHLFKIPKYIWKQLYKYQRVSVKWLWELHTRNLGGLLGDEMGLGKTVQVIAFLAGLDCSELLSDGGRFRGLGPTLIICPATLLEQWVNHFRNWWPVLRVVILHQSGTFQGNTEDLLESLKAGGVLITSYSGVLIHKESLLQFKWHYVILDEGHLIRNPDAKVSKIVKRFLTPHRLLLTGSPMQNSLKELWSLFDFILPGKLGTLNAFMEHCAGPITRGGYSNASALQEATALQVATMLKDAITPYMLRRTKYDIRHHINLPSKNEQVLFCSLTEEQRQLYKQYIRSDDVSLIMYEKRESLKYRARLFAGLTALRKLCNHPDLFLYSEGQMESDEEMKVEANESEIKNFGHWKRAGKMTVVHSLLKIWKKQGHRVLLFTQSRQMLHILEGLLQREKYSYLRMDGTTPMNQRQSVISKFNNDNSFFVFLLTTKVGGIGVNLIGANRVVIYDPDWNPATDAQARERAWRIGQHKNVTIYRLITVGTIEEKIYHRQVFKILLSNKVLEDPRQRRLFRTADLTELFNLNEPIDGKSESDQLFHDSKLLPNQPCFTSSKLEEMKKLASALSKKIGNNAASDETIVKEDTRKTFTNNIMPEKKTDELTEQTTYLSSVRGNQNIVENSENDREGNGKLSSLSTEKTIIRAKNEESVNSNVNLENNDLCTDNNTLYNNSMVDEKDKMVEMKNFNQGNIQSSTSEKMCVDPQELGDIPDLIPKLISEPTDIKIKNTFNNSKKITECSKTYGKRKKPKRHKCKEVSAIFEGERVCCLIGRRIGKSNEVNSSSISEDQFVLSKLFGKTAVNSAFQHESVLSSAVLDPAEETLLQRTAKETASEKMDSIRQSRKWCWKPSWDKQD